MALALKLLSLIQFQIWVNSLFPLLAHWGNKNWPPSMKVKKLENFQNKSGSRGCKWSRLNGPGTENPQSHPFLKLGEFLFLIISPLALREIGFNFFRNVMIWNKIVQKSSKSYRKFQKSCNVMAKLIE